MKNQHRIHTFALSMLMTGLSVMPVWAFNGQIDSGFLETVTCVNHDTGQAVPGTVSGAGFDCSALPRGEGDRIGVVLVGTADDEPPCSGGASIQEEVEPNNDINQAQDLGGLQGCSITVTGETTIGIGPDPNNNPNPGADFDWYMINTSGASQPVFDLPGFNGTWFFVVVDLDTDQQLDVLCGDAGCAIQGQPSRVALLLVTEEAAAYTLQFSDGATNVGLQSLSKSTYGGQRGQQLRW